MSTIDRPKSPALPPLSAGQRLDPDTFHDRYEAMPPATRAELIDGIVHMPSPVGSDHSDMHSNAVIWLGCYRAATPGVRETDNASLRLGGSSEVQPDATLYILSECGGQSRRERRFYLGAPELVVEVSATTLATDLGAKRELYGRSGVLEYLIVATEPGRVIRHGRRDDQWIEVPPGPDSLHRSEVFPGLWLDPAALLADDIRGVLDALNRGLATPEHAAFVEQLARARQG